MITVVSKGLLTTVQDGGRLGFRNMGVPTCGAFDSFAMMRANALCANDLKSAVLEITALGPTLQFESACVFAVTGGDFDIKLNGKAIQKDMAHCAPKGAILQVGTAKSGLRGYIAFAGGLKVKTVLGSKATYLAAKFGGLSGGSLSEGAQIELENPCHWLFNMESRNFPWQYKEERCISLVSGPQRAALSAEGESALFHGQYTVCPNSDRMGIRFAGDKVQLNTAQGIISEGIMPGAMQIAGGQPIIMGVDSQTVGGYAKPFFAITADFQKLAQLKPGDRVSFEQVSHSTAQKQLKSVMLKIKAFDRQIN